MAGIIRKIAQSLCKCPEPPPVPEIIKSVLSTKERATYARKLMENPLWEEVFEDLRDDAFKLWVGTSLEDVEQREYLWKHFQLIGVLQRRLKAYVTTVTIEEDMEARMQKTRNP